MSYVIKIAQPTFLGNEVEYVCDALRDGSLSMGRHVEMFEDLLMARMGAQFALATTNGTTALHLALLALGVGPGDWVVMPACSYVATANAVRYCGGTPVLVDVRPDTWTLDAESASRAAIVHGAVGTITVNLYGVPCGLPRARWVLDDACESHGTALMGDVSVLSFYGNKIVTTGEGGAILTNREDIAAQCALLRGQGQGSRRYEHVTLGYNGRMTDLQAALGRGQMEKLDEHLTRRASLRATYDAYLPEYLERQSRPAGSVDWVVPVLIPNGRRDAVAQELDDRGIETRPVFPSLDGQEHLARHVVKVGDLSVSHRIAADGLLLPLHLGMSETDVMTVCRALDRAIKRAA